jgi:phosphoribosylanthranilate isomerase
MADVTRSPRIKICCIASEAEAALAMEAGADLLGLVSAMPSGPGPIAEERIAEIIRWVDGRAETVLLTSRQEAEPIAEQLRRMRPSVVQLVDELADDEYRRLRDAHAAVTLMQVIHVTGEASVREAARVAPFVDRILLDSGNPAAAVKELGGTGRVHDWALSREIRETVAVPMLLAGGLNAGNVGEAIRRVGPFGVDVCSGVRTGGRLDADKLRAFVGAVRAAG